MNLKTIFGAAAFALALPFAASAATLTINGDSSDITTQDYMQELDVSADFYSVIIEAAEGDVGPISFKLVNNTFEPAAVTFVDGNINQSDRPGDELDYGFSGAVADWFDDEVTAGVKLTFGDEVAYYGFLEENGGFEYSTILGVGDHVVLSFDFGGVVCAEGATNDNCPVIDFEIAATPVPVPAAGFLLLGGLGGLAMLRRRKKS